MIIFIIIFMWVYPNIIQPLFNKFTDLEEGELKQKIFKLAEKVNYPLTKIYVIDASTRTSHSNAYLYGLGKNKRIVLFDTLIERLDHNEIEAVLGHELGHWVYSHNIKLLIFSLLHIFIIFFIFGYFVNDPRMYLSYGFKNKSIFIGLMLYMGLYDPISYIIDIFQMKLTRVCEYQADSFAHTLGYADQLISGLKKLFEKNLSDMDPDPLFSLVNHSHPTLIERVRALNQLKEQDNIKNK